MQYNYESDAMPATNYAIAMTPGANPGPVATTRLYTAMHAMRRQARAPANASISL